jgi:hypothetical protein
MVTDIWNIKQYRTKLHPVCFFVELKPAPNNKDIFNVEYAQQRKIKIELPKHKRDIAQCANCQWYGNTKNYCHLHLRCVKCACNHLTNQCHRKERSSHVQCVLCGSNHPANYKDLQKETYPPPCPKIYPSACTNQINPMHPIRSNICSNNKTKLLLPIKHTGRTKHQPITSALSSIPKSSNRQELKNRMKGLFEQMGTMLNLFTAMHTKLK